MVGTPEEWLAKKNKVDVPVGNLSDFDLRIVGSPARIEIPFSDLYKLRGVADLLKGYCNRIDELTRRNDLPIRSVLFELSQEARIINKRIRQMYPELYKRKYPLEFD